MRLKLHTQVSEPIHNAPERVSGTQAFGSDLFIIIIIMNIIISVFHWSSNETRAVKQNLYITKQRL